MNTYPKLFSPIKIGETTVKNRVFMPPISTNLADKGYVTERLVLGKDELQPPAFGAVL